MAKQFATLQQLRSFNLGEHPLNLAPGQFAVNMAAGNFEPEKNNYQMYIYIGNGSNQRIDQGGQVLVTGGTDGQGWVRYPMRALDIEGDTIYGDFNVSGSRLAFQVRNDGGVQRHAELIVPVETTAPSDGTSSGSVRWNTQTSIFEAWNGSKWDTTAKVTVATSAPATPSNGDLWMDPGPPAILYVYVVPSVGPASWIPASSGGSGGGLQPGNGVSANSLNQIDIINQGSF